MLNIKVRISILPQLLQFSLVHFWQLGDYIHQLQLPETPQMQYHWEQFIAPFSV